jgi:tRNA(Ile)-lysidine synthase
MVSEFEHFVKKNTLFTRKHKLLLATSGGRDSVCLFHLLLQSGFSFSVAHCNFGLREKDSNNDEKFVKALCDKHQITCHSIRFDTTAMAEKMQTGIQETARTLRYQWFDSLMKSNNYSKLLTAHHMGDNTETMLINLLRSTGISGLHGIPFNTESICRPLMFTDRNGIDDFIRKNKLKYREDASNASDDYLRNSIRHHVIPELEKIEPKTNQSFFKSSQEIAEFETLSLYLMDQTWQSFCKEENAHLHVSESIFSLPENILTSLLFYSLRPYGFSRAQTDAICGSKKTAPGFKQFSAEWELFRERDGFILRKKSLPEKNLKKISEKTKKVVLNGLTIDIQKIDKKAVKLGQSNCLFFDSGKITYPLIIRPWKAGDKIQALGMKGRKNISDILTDRKIPHADREAQLVIIDQTNKILALLPDIVSETCKLDAQSLAILRIRMNPAKFVYPITTDK